MESTAGKQLSLKPDIRKGRKDEVSWICSKRLFDFGKFPS